MVKQPLLDAEQIAARQNVLAVFYEDTLLRQQVRDDCLRGLPDVERLCRKLVAGRATLQDLCVLYQFAVRLPDLVGRLQSYSGEHKNVIASMVCLFVCFCSFCSYYYIVCE